MKKVYDEFFGVSEDGIVREKVMLTRVVITVTVMVVCLIAMGLSAFAYFSSDVSSNSNIIRAANFDMKVTVHRLSEGESHPVSVTQTEKRTYAVTLEPGFVYLVKLEKRELQRPVFA